MKAVFVYVIFIPMDARLSASLLIARPCPDGMYEILLTQRKKGMIFSEAFVFPGGKWEPADSLNVWGERLGTRPEVVPGTPLTRELELNSLKVTAIRETFEESGIFIGPGSLGLPVSGDFYQLCNRKGLLPDLSRLRYFTRIVGPIGYPPRFDTVYFLTTVPAATHFTLTEESQSAQWLRPAELLERAVDLRLLEPQCLLTVLLAHYPLFQELVRAEPLPVLKFPLMSVLRHPELEGGYVVIAYGDEQYPTPSFLPQIQGHRFRICLQRTGIQYEISPGLLPFLDSSPWTLLPDSTGRLRIQPKVRL